MNETLIIAGGIYTAGLVIFHLLFWRIFKWPETIMTLNYINKATMQVLNISITFIFVIFAYISLLVLMSILWLFRAVLQVVFYKLKHKASVGLTIYFLIGAFLYGVPIIT